MLEFPKRMKVAGTHVGKRPKSIRKYVNRGTKFVLQREPSNIHDVNAIKVKQRFKNGGEFHLGYVPAKYAAEMAPMMDDGHKFNASFSMKILNDRTGEVIGLVITVSKGDRDNGKTP